MQEFLGLLATFHCLVQRLQARVKWTLAALDQVQVELAVPFVTKYETLVGKIKIKEHCPVSAFASLVSISFAKLHAMVHETGKLAALGPPWCTSLGE